MCSCVLYSRVKYGHILKLRVRKGEVSASNILQGKELANYLILVHTPYILSNAH